VKWIRSFGSFWNDFIVGDDWRLAVGVVTAVIIVLAATHQGIYAWWLLPIAVAALLTVSVAREARRVR